MKTTKKGFTLIELIVVIAIIGVLAAILIPALLGYVKKSKVTAANSSAASLYNAINTVLTELDEEGVDTGEIKGLSYTKNSKSVTVSKSNAAPAGSADKDPDSGEEVYKSLKEYFNDVDKLNFQANCEGGTCVAVACAQDSTYTGSKPTVVTRKNYKDYQGTDGITKALKEATEKAKAEEEKNS
ncbi:MAG: prepilin-type N-terminal cleavage/methylation domain-containing protein [Ruminococcus sp.]|nr:prepilin-type N-terminal cleavage/methylation domain-containing protein [Ruminococcus sp.]